MKVYVVTELTGEYSQTSFSVAAVFATMELAEDYVAKMAARPGIESEYGPGNQSDYDINEMEVWDVPTERVMQFHIHKGIAPGETHPAYKLYRNEEYAPPGYEGFWEAVREWDPESGWSYIDVCQPTEELAHSEFRRLLDA